MTVTVSNKPNQVDFDLSKVSISSKYNIIFHYVYDPFSHFETEFAFLNNNELDEHTLIILWHPVEMGTWDQYWINKLNAAVAGRKFKLVYLTGCSNCPDLNQHYQIDFEYFFFPIFDIRAANIWSNRPAEITTSKSNKFTCLNAKDNSHRRFIFAQLYKHNLLPDGITSYKCLNWDSTYDHSSFEFSEGQGFTAEQLDTIHKANQSLLHILPINLDNGSIVNNLPRSVFLDSYVSVCSETDFINVPFGHRRNFVTEKTFNSIANNQIFFIVGHANSLEVLRSLGYITFSDIINESYDQIEHNGTRLHAVSQEIIRFLSRDITEIQRDYIKVREIIQHNRDLLFKQNLQQRLQQLINTL